MAFSLAVFLLVLAANLAFSQSAEQSCYSEKVQGEACYMQCCRSLGYAWDGEGCSVPDADRNYVAMQCSYCTDRYLSCIDEYNMYSNPQTSSTDTSCCSGFALLAALILVSSKIS
ncbi:MAG: hypothetical protein QW035_02360 [Candidatus Anstonellales archaeon]